MIYYLKYRENGEKKSKRFDIDFVSNSVIRKQGKIVSTMLEVKVNAEKLETNLRKIQESISSNDPKEEINALKKENQELIKSISTVGNSYYFDERFAVIKQILEQNGEKEEKFLSKDFWDDCVDVKDLIDFITSCVNKDVPKKKQ